MPSVIEALSLVMADVQGIGKDGTNTQQGYKFRGVDAVVNAVGPVFRKHGVVVVPIQATCESEHYTTARGTQMRGVTLTVGFRFYGPDGDFIEAMTCGEASDSGDKAVPKAHSVAYRTLLLQALCIPTGDPDPDSESHERGETAAKDNGKDTSSTFQVPAAAGANLATDPQRKAMYAIATKLHEAGKLTASQHATVVAASNDPGTTKTAAGAAIERLKKIEAEAAIEVEA